MQGAYIFSCILLYLYLYKYLTLNFRPCFKKLISRRRNARNQAVSPGFIKEECRLTLNSEREKYFLLFGL